MNSDLLLFAEVFFFKSLLFVSYDVMCDSGSHLNDLYHDRKYIQGVFTFAS